MQPGALHIRMMNEWMLLLQNYISGNLHPPNITNSHNLFLRWVIFWRKTKGRPLSRVLSYYHFQGCAIVEFLILFDLQYSWRLFCNTNINNNIGQGCFAIATSITISERGALQYQFQYNTIRCMFCNSNINTNVSRGCFAISISVVTLAWCVLQYQSQYNNHFLALTHYSNPSGKWN